MELHRITRLIQKETDRLLKDFLNDNPDLLQKYVDGGVTAVGIILSPLNAFMRHLLIIKGLDPDQEPGERQRKELFEAVGSLFNATHDNDFDEDYDFSWVQKKFEEARKNLGHLGLTKNKFKELTDLDKLPNLGSYVRYPTVQEEQEYFSSYPSTRLPDKEIRVTNYGNVPTVSVPGGNAVTEEPVAQEYQNLRSALHEIIRGAEKVERGDAFGFDPGEAIKKLVDVAQKAREITKKEIEKESTKKEKAGIKTSKKKLNRGKGTKVNRVPATVEDQETHNIRRNTLIKRNGLKENIEAKHNKAKELVDYMVARGLCSDDKEAIQTQLQEILLMNDDSIESLGRVARKHTNLPTDDKFKGSFRRTQK
jgi:hypothetical protein